MFAPFIIRNTIGIEKIVKSASRLHLFIGYILRNV